MYVEGIAPATWWRWHRRRAQWEVRRFCTHPHPHGGKDSGQVLPQKALRNRVCESRLSLTKLFRKGQKGRRGEREQMLLPGQAVVLLCSKEQPKQNRSGLSFWSFFMVVISCCLSTWPWLRCAVPFCPIWNSFLVSYRPTLVSHPLSRAVGLAARPMGVASFRPEPHQGCPNPLRPGGLACSWFPLPY